MAVENVVVDGGTVRFTPSGFSITGIATATLSANSGTKVQKGNDKAILSNHQWSSVQSNTVGYTVPSGGFTATPGSGTFRASSISSGIATNMKSGTTSVILESASGSAIFDISSPALNPQGTPDPIYATGPKTRPGDWEVTTNGQGNVKLKSD